MEKLIAVLVFTLMASSSSLPSHALLNHVYRKFLHTVSFHLSLRLPRFNADSNMKAGRISKLPWLQKVPSTKSQKTTTKLKQLLFHSASQICLQRFETWYTWSHLAGNESISLQHDPPVRQPPTLYMPGPEDISSHSNCFGVERAHHVLVKFHVANLKIES